MLPENIKKILEKQHYRVAGNHSAVQICLWTKKSLRGKGGCWKEKFYGIESHRCCQMSPAVMNCENQCLHCWRKIEMNLGVKLGKADEPKKIIDEIIKARKKLLTGFGGNEKTLRKKFKEALEPNLFTFSLAGEPTLYPKLGEMIKEIRKRKAISFLVTNGQNPDAIEKLEKENALPIQLTVSTNAPNKELFKLWHNSVRKDAWERFNKTLKLMKKLKGRTRRVIRLTLVREQGENKLSNMKPEYVKEYAELIRKAEPDFIHVKAFKSVGFARQRLGYDKQPYHEDVREFAKKLVKELKAKNYKILAEEKESCVVLLGKNKSEMKIKKSEI